MFLGFGRQSLSIPVPFFLFVNCRVWEFVCGQISPVHTCQMGGVRTCVHCDVQSLAPSAIALDAAPESTSWGIYGERSLTCRNLQTVIAGESSGLGESTVA